MSFIDHPASKMLYEHNVNLKDVQSNHKLNFHCAAVHCPNKTIPLLVAHRTDPSARGFCPECNTFENLFIRYTDF